MSAVRGEIVLIVVLGCMVGGTAAMTWWVSRNPAAPRPVTAPDPALREWAYQKALGYKEQKLNRQRTYTARLEAALRKQKAQTADDQRYIDALEAVIIAPLLAEIRAEMKAIRSS